MCCSPHTEEICRRNPTKHVVRHPTDCASYVECHRGTVFLRTCGQGLHYNELKGVCDYPELAGCRPGTETWTQLVRIRYIYLSLCMCLCVCVCVGVPVLLGMCACLPVCIYVFVCVCLCLRVYMHTCFVCEWVTTRPRRAFPYSPFCVPVISPTSAPHTDVVTGKGSNDDDDNNNNNNNKLLRTSIITHNVNSRKTNIFHIFIPYSSIYSKFYLLIVLKNYFYENTGFRELKVLIQNPHERKEETQKIPSFVDLTKYVHFWRTVICFRTFSHIFASFVLLYSYASAWLY